MTAITALYVTHPTTFNTDQPIVAMTGQVYPAGVNQLPAGIYRLVGSVLDAHPAGAAMAALGGAKSYLTVTQDAKGPWPDPPSAVLQATGTSPEVVVKFLSGAGEVSAV